MSNVKPLKILFNEEHEECEHLYGIQKYNKFIDEWYHVCLKCGWCEYSKRRF